MSEEQAEGPWIAPSAGQWDKHEIVIRISGDRMRIEIDYPATPEDCQTLLRAVRRQLVTQGVPEEWLGEAFEQRFQELENHEGPVAHHMVVEGDPGEPAKDGYIAWSGDFFSTGFVVDEETGAVDYRQRSAQTSVQTSQLLATVVPPQPGRNGRDVLGRMVAAPRGYQPVIIAGRGVRYEAASRSYYATEDGRIRWTGRTLTVEAVYEVDGDVGLATGNIDHLGTVHVKGDITSGSSVTATGDIEVNGIIEAADVKAGGNLVVHGGIVGRGRRPITVGGRLHARFLSDASIEVGRDIVIEREAVQSLIKTRGTLAMRFGRLVGGECIALQGAILGQTGTDASVPTIVRVGEDFRLQAQIETLHAELDALEPRRDKIRAVIGPDPQRRSLRSETMSDTVQRLASEAEALDRRIAQVYEEIQRKRTQSMSSARPRVEVTRVAYPETRFSLCNKIHVVQDPEPGPMHLLLLDGEVALRPGRLNWRLPAGLEEQEEEAASAPDDAEPAAEDAQTP